MDKCLNCHKHIEPSYCQQILGSIGNLQVKILVTAGEIIYLCPKCLLNLIKTKDERDGL